MSTIVTQTIGGVPDQRISVANASYFARPHGFGTNWQTLRVAVRFVFGNIGANLTNTPKWFVGLCSGTTNPFGSASPTNAIGYYHSYVGGTWNYAAASGGNMTGYYHGNSNFAFSAKGVAGVYTIGPIVGNGDVTYLPADFTTATRRMLFVDIGKGSPNYTVRVFYPNQPTAAPDVLSSDFINWYTAVNPQFTNHNFPGAVSMAFSESGGTLDCINVSWNNVQAPCHICDLAVAKIA